MEVKEFVFMSGGGEWEDDAVGIEGGAGGIVGAFCEDAGGTGVCGEVEAVGDLDVYGHVYVGQCCLWAGVSGVDH